MTRFKIIINCGPCQDFIGTCLASVQEQSWTHWDALVTVDPCGDSTYSRALDAARGDSRISVRLNGARHYSMRNLIHAIRRSNAGPEDVIVSLDGDDWFATPDALRTIAEAYETDDCWLTYGSWLSNVVGPTGRKNGLWPAYPEGTTDFRAHRFLATAVRTWKRWLWDYLEDADLRSDTGDYVRVSEDQVIMIPMLELCGTSHTKHIPAALMTYNKLATYPADPSITEEGARNGDLLARRPRYAPLKHKFYKETAASVT